jgi:DNA-binding winged helix-turn-helix (wHTH) protein
MKYKINGFLLSADINTAVRGEEKINFTHQETEALKLFFASEGGFVDSQALESMVWGDRVVTQNSLRKLISGIRFKLDDKDSFKNIRSKGYQLTFEVVGESVEKTSQKFSKSFFAIAIMSFFLSIIAILYAFYLPHSITALPKVSQQTVFESHDFILDYATYNDALYVTTRDSKTSKLYKTLNRQNTVLLSADYPGAYRGIEIHSSGRTVMHVVEDSECKIKIFDRPVENQIDEIPCNRQNAYPSFDWIDKTKFYITFNVTPSASIKPYIYDIETKLLQEVTTTNFNSENSKRFVDSFIKAQGTGMFTLRENHLDEMSLMYFDGDKRKTLYKYRSKPFSIAVSKSDLFFVGNNNELLRMSLTDDVYSQETNTSYVLAPQTVKIDDPLFLQNELYFSLGNTAKEVIFSTSGKFKYSLENTIIDFTYTTKTLSILALTNSGYVVEQLKDGTVFNTIYFDSKLSLRHLAFHQGDIYLAGASGIYKLVDNELIIISDIKAIKLVSNGQCMITEAENGIFQFEAETNSFDMFAVQGERAFPSKYGCLFVDNLSGYIVNEKREKIAKPILKKYLFEHKGRITQWHSVGDQTHMVDIESGEIIAKTKNRVLYKRVISYEDDILYLRQDDVRTSIVKIKLY